MPSVMPGVNNIDFDGGAKMDTDQSLYQSRSSEIDISGDPMIIEKGAKLAEIELAQEVDPEALQSKDLKTFTTSTGVNHQEIKIM